MNGPSLRLRRAGESGIPYVESLLAENDLPSRDVREKPGCFYVGYDGADRVGVGGVEIYGGDGLLRSVVVERSARGNGFGMALCEQLEATARDEGVGALYLLTTTAAGFFADRGYAEIERAGAPAAVRETTEFSDLCPASAVCMMKDI